MKSFLLVMLLMSFGFGHVHAQQIMGGDITWECSNDKYVFQLRVFNQCSKGKLSRGNQTIQVRNASLSNISLSFISETDISPACYDRAQTISCDSLNPFAISEGIYRSLPISLSGVPDTAGWIFTWTNCCRPDLMNIQGNTDFTLRSIMYPYQNKNTSVCYDDAPNYIDPPATISCLGYRTKLNHRAYDPDNDDLEINFSRPMANSSQWPPNYINYKPGFNVTNPFPNSYHNSNNVSPSMLNYNGEIDLHVFGPSALVTYGTKTSSYRNGALIAEVHRELILRMDSCPPTKTIPPLANNPPDVTFKRSPSDPSTLAEPYLDSVNIGDTVRFHVSTTDIQFLPGFTGQSNTMIPRSVLFSPKYSSTQNCALPPCAILDTSGISYSPAGNFWQMQFGVTTDFEWIPDSNHMGKSDKVYNFFFYVQDDWCPVPSNIEPTYTVVVRNGMKPNDINEFEHLEIRAKIFPNPVSIGFTIDYKSKPNKILQLDLINLLGEIEISRTYTPKNGHVKTWVDTDHLTAGIYFVRLSSGESTITKKIIVK